MIDEQDNPNKVKDPSAVLDYFIDWNDHPSGPWLAEGDSISSAVWSIAGPDTALTQPAGKPSTFAGGRCTIWLAGGTEGVRYNATCHIVTAQGREDDRTLTVTIRNR